MEALVLMYHQIVPDGAFDGWVPSHLADPRYGVTRREFARQMAHLREEGYRILSLEELLASCPPASNGASDDRPAIVVTFDDGYETDFTLALPLLSHLRIPATFFLSTGHIGAPGMLTETMAAELCAPPLFRIGGHGESHRFLSEMSERDCLRELARSFERIREISGQEKLSMSAPGGRTSPRVAALAQQAGFRGLATSRPGLYRVREDPFSIPRLPILQRHTLQDFSDLIDPRSRVHRTDWWVRRAKQAARWAF
jgi:peptidoglycan/xylan/chitin deacetylase (PgdA/CDA1 family)